MSDKHNHVVATLVSVTGGAPGELGAKIIVSKNQIAGTIGGGKIEAKVIRHARELLEKESAVRFDSQTWNLRFGFLKRLF